MKHLFNKLNFYKVFALILAILFVNIVFAQQLTNKNVHETLSSAISQIHFGSSNDPLHGLTITWKSSGSNDSITWGYTDAFEKGTFSGAKRDGNEKYFYDYEFPALNAKDTIHYKIYNSFTATWTSEKIFRTAADVNTTKFSFLVMGDSRSYVEDWRDVSQAANRDDHTDFTLFTGDIVSRGGRISDWNEWFDYGKEFLADNLLYHTIGNHECREYNGNSGIDAYLNIFKLPENNTGTELYYSFTYGNAIFICLDTEEDKTSTESSVQYNWLKETLAANQDKTWKILLFHRPFYTTGEHKGEMDYKMNTWFDAFDQYGVDLIFNGHDHMYERTKPVQKDGKVVSEYGSGENQGRCQVVCGGAGAPLYDTGTADWLETGSKKHHYCKISIDGDQLKMEVFDVNNTRFDEVTLKKDPLLMNKYDIDEQVKIFPNPANNQIIIKKSNLEMDKIKIYNTNGQDFTKSVHFSRSNANIVIADLSKLPQGVYFIQLQSNSYKIFKN